MKGLVFTELLEYVEDNFGFDMADKIIEDANLANDGAFTQAGNYPFEELVKLLAALSKESNIEIPKLLEIFGEHMFTRLISLNPQLKNNFESSLDLISKVDNIIHPEVEKLYPGADLPKFNLINRSENKVVIDYISSKHLEPFAIGLMKGSAKNFNEKIIISQEKVNDITRFTLELEK
ncbi:heme NO-binding domain-containing protein [Poseidonibacter ostreae]|jgi:hypothetical protein|uniref:Heme NO-binding domain-containing protein n=1 Tax=Poseidonibacter ostreae TaxID=2654171 RepID=A0A6L4WN75_9BACT|nr:heme NO-binding domain-containing protein [Poseidonibacter ostreae]KAB7883061.1 hypothetical protein GA417_13210 [Poseidonibacter ostreae]KAB7884466.1 hypothetical protein GBG19_15740 [Poseidonibacter ostreae]KAB7888469.1 hypothetical protein GBG18_12975 [Poseidonibacter ostreae]